MKKYLAIALTLVLSLGLLAGCSSAPASSAAAAPAASTSAPAESKAPAEAGGVIYGIYKSGDQTWFLDEGAAAKEAAEAAGYTFNYVDVQLSPEAYLKAIDNAIANNAVGVVTCPPDQTISQAVVDKLDGAKIPVVAADDALQTADGTKIAPWVGINAYKIGEANGEWLGNYANENKLATDPEVGLLLMTIDTVSSCVPRIEGEQAKFAEICPDFDAAKTFKADYDGTTDKGNVAAAAVITAHPEIKKWLVTGANEEGCIGAARALESAGLDADAYVVGLGGYMAKDEFKKEGGSCVKASAYFSAQSVGAGSVQILLDLIAGKTPEMETAVDATVVTKDNYKEVMGTYAE